MSGVVYEPIALEDFYTPFEGIKEALAAREHLRQNVEKEWSSRAAGRPPLPDLVAPAFIARQVATASYEDLMFFFMAKKAGLDPCWLEFTVDKFVSVSAEKVRFLSYLRCAGRGRKGGLKLSRVKLAELAAWEGKELRQVVDASGRPIVDHHHELQRMMIPEARRLDFSDWLTVVGKAKSYYQYFLSFAVCHGVLFEDFHGAKAEAGFLQRVVTPAWHMVEIIFGQKPLIVRLPYSPERDYFPAPDSDWREHGLIPAELI